MTRLQIYQRLRDIVDNSNVDDALELLAYCDKQIIQIEQSQLPPDQKKKNAEEKNEELSKYVIEVLDTEKFLPYTIIIQRLQERFPQQPWSKYHVQRALGYLARHHVLEKIGIKYRDPETLQIKSGNGYRKIEGARFI